MLALFIIQEIAMVLFYLSLPAFSIWLFLTERKRYKKVNESLNKYDNIVRDVANKLLEKADDEKPIVLTVDTQNLIKKVIEEMEKENLVKRRGFE